jgi:diacylglycerol kinase family enzyme
MLGQLMDLTLIVNPYASAVTEPRVRAVEVELGRVAEVRTLLTERPGHGGELAASAETDAIVVFSGDGGFNEVLNGVRDSQPLGLLPGGGTNVMARALGLSRHPEAAAREVADALTAGRTRTISVGRVNGRRFGFNAGIGFDAELVRRIDARGRAADGRRPGDAAFVREAIGLITAHRGRLAESLEIEDAGRAAFVLVANCVPYTYAGRLPVRVAREASFDAGLDVVAPASVGPLGMLRLLASLLRGATPRRGLTVLHDVDRVVVTCDRPMALQVDGEDIGDVERVVFESEPRAVRALVPA